MELHKPVTHEDIHARLASGQQRFSQVEETLAELKASIDTVIKGQAEIRTTIKPISDEISEIKEIVGAWKALGTVGKFVKWVSGLLAGLAVIWAAAKVK